MLKRLAMVAFALLFAVGVTAQMMPHAASAMTMKGDGGAPCDMARGDGAQSRGMPAAQPCKGMIPVCVDSLGCVVFVDLPSPLATAWPVDWIAIDWSAGGSWLTGLTVEPELSPPIRKT